MEKTETLPAVTEPKTELPAISEDEFKKRFKESSKGFNLASALDSAMKIVKNPDTLKDLMSGKITIQDIAADAALDMAKKGDLELPAAKKEEPKKLTDGNS